MAAMRGDEPGGDEREPAAAVRQAIFLARAGQDAEAERLCREALAVDPDCFDALALLGSLMHQQGRDNDADELLARASAVRPQAADVLAARGLVLAALGRYEDGLAVLDAALAIRPDFFEALVNRGNALLRLGRHEAAAAAFDRALAMRPDDAGVLTHRGVALLELGRVEEALASHARALELEPDSVAALTNHGNALVTLGRFEPALESLSRAIELAPDHLPALRFKAKALRALKRNEEALPLYQAAFSAQADAAGALDVGNAFVSLGLYAEALTAFDRALSLEPEMADALNNRGNVLRSLHRHREALDSYARALAVAPDHVDAHWNEGLTWLTLGDFERGWGNYEWRRQGLSDAPSHLRRGIPVWDGSQPLAGRTILLHTEQGLGDAIQFVRYAPLVAERGARVLVACRSALAALFRTVPGVADVVTVRNAEPAVDYQALLMSLPLAFGTRLDTVPAPIPYVRADPDRVRSWQARLAAHETPRNVGLAWRGNPEHSGARTRDCPVEVLAPLVAVPGCTFYSLQLEEGAADVAALTARDLHVVDLADTLGDFYETAAAVCALDLVVSVDTAVAHLAGALGRPAWLLLPFDADWRWLLDREDSPWYPSLRLFRQATPGDWQGVVRRVAAELDRLEGA